MNCNICGKKYIKKAYFDKHMNSHLKNKPSVSGNLHIKGNIAIDYNNNYNNNYNDNTDAEIDINYVGGIPSDMVTGLNHNEELDLAITLSLLEQDEERQQKELDDYNNGVDLSEHIKTYDYNDEYNIIEESINNENKKSVNNDEVNNTTCVICLSEKRELAFIPCGHMVTCNNCSQHLMKSDSKKICPICRKPIKSLLKIYN
jgi:hypothetical protein